MGNTEMDQKKNKNDIGITENNKVITFLVLQMFIKLGFSIVPE